MARRGEGGGAGGATPRIPRATGCSWSAAADSRRPLAGTRRALGSRAAVRVKQALARLTGFEARIAPGRIELAFSDEFELAELVEALERAARTASP